MKVLKSSLKLVSFAIDNPDGVQQCGASSGITELFIKLFCLQVVLKPFVQVTQFAVDDAKLNVRLHYPGAVICILEETKRFNEMPGCVPVFSSPAGYHAKSVDRLRHPYRVAQ